MKSNNNIKVVILAGGKGTRFNPFSFVIPKPLMPINQNPIILYLVKSFRKFNFKNFLISTGYQSELIKAYLGNGKKFGVKIKYYNENIPLGTAGPLFHMRKDIKINEYFFLINGDVYTEINFQNMLNFAKKGNYDVVVGYIKKEFKNNFGVLNIKNNNIESIIEKPVEKYNVSSGIYVIKNSKNLKIIPKNKFFTVPELISKFLSKKLKAGAYEVNKYWMGIENMEDLVKVENRIKKKFK